MSDVTPSFVDGLAVYHRVRDGERVLLVHGSMDRSASFVKAARRLDDLDVVRYDRRGYGRSIDAGICASIDAQVDDLLTVLGDRPATVVGHSLGGLLALLASARAPQRIRSVGAFEAPMPWEDWWPRESAGSLAVRAAHGEGPAAAAEVFMRSMLGDERWQRLPSSTRDARRAEGAALVAELRAIREVAVLDPASITVPVVAGLGTASDPQHQRAARTLAAARPGTELVELPGATHGAHYADPAGFAAFVHAAVSAAGSQR